MAKFSKGDTIIHVETQRKGVIKEVRPYARGRQVYIVRYDDADNDDRCLEQKLDFHFDMNDPFERVKKGIFENRDQFVLVNTTYKINNSNNNTISSLKASKTIFKAYQFKPLLKFLNSYTRRILVADEVGLGKTIEAGHILLELKARNEFKSALIVCPNSLKIKWQTELQEKFGLRFKIYQSLHDAVEDIKTFPQSARGILNYEKIRVKNENNEDSTDNTEESNLLIDYLKSKDRRYSIVLCDEAHKLRNNTTLQYKGMSEILNYADSVVFLTATPIMLGEDDLYNLLHLLEPTKFNNKEVFRNLIYSNRPFVQAISLLNSNRPLVEIKDLLTKGDIILSTQIGDYFSEKKTSVQEVYKGIALYEKIINLLQKEDSLALRAELQDNITALSSINNVFSRTRKRDVSIDERQQTERKAHKVDVNLTESERKIYDSVIDDYIESKGGVECDIYGEEILPRGAVLGLIQKKRMVASSVNGYKLFSDNNCDVDAFCADIASCAILPDAKVEKLIEIANGVKYCGGSKLIVFSIFKFTVRYLYILLKRKGYKVFAIHGDIKERETIINEFKNYNEFCILLSTEVGSEGLDMQFCSHLVNYDLPWNPMVVEQRIGRIDRFGQKAEQIHIYNLVVHNSIQEQIYDRLLDRIGIFRGVIGDLEMILEDKEMKDAFRKLENDLYGTKLSPESREKKIRDIERAIENQKIHLDQVEEGMTNALSNDIYFQNEISKIRNSKLYVTEEELKNYINMLILDYLKTCDLNPHGNREYILSVPKSTPRIVANFLTSHQPSGCDFDDLFKSYKNYLLSKVEDNDGYIITFDQDYAFDNKAVDYVNIYNPIIIAASLYFRNRVNSIGNTFQLKYKLSDSIEIQTGLYYLAVYTISVKKEIMGKVVNSEILVPVFYNVKEDRTITDENLNMTLFGEIQEKAEYLNSTDNNELLSPDACNLMESDFTSFIDEYETRIRKEMVLKDDSQRQLLKRQLEEYYSERQKKEETYIYNQEYDLQWLNDKRDISSAKNRLHLAKMRLKNLLEAKETDFNKLNSYQEPTISSTLISVSKIIIE